MRITRRAAVSAIASCVSAYGQFLSGNAKVRGQVECITNNVFHWYVDSVNGNDSHSGTAPNQAIKTIAALTAKAPTARQRIGLARGSYWYEGFDSAANNLLIGAYGSGDPPTLDGADAIPTSAWTLSTDGSGVLYQFTYVRGGGGVVGQNSPLIWVNGVQIPWIGTLSGCVSSPGSFYYPAPQQADATITIYLHPAGGTNPVTDGNLYEVTVRGSGVYLYGATGASVLGVRCRRSWGHYGPLSVGRNQTISQCIVDGGGIHHTVHGLGVLSDVVLLDMPLGITAPPNIPATSYEPSPSGTPIYQRVFILGSPATRDIQGGQGSFFGHGSTGTWAGMQYLQCYAKYMSGFSSVGTTLVSDCFVENGNVGSQIAGDTVVRRSLFRNCVGFSGQKFIMGDAGPADVYPGTRVIENSIVYVDSALINYTNAVDISSRQGSLTLRNCVLIFESAGVFDVIPVQVSSNGPGSGLTLNVEGCIFYKNNANGSYLIRGMDASVTYVGDHNIFVINGTPFFTFAGSFVFGLPAWIAATGQDAHSVTMTAAQWSAFWSGIIANGDFRINPTAQVTDANGTIYTGQFPDGTPITAAGPQEHWDWNTRAISAGPPTAWPVPPQNISQAATYVQNPRGWTF